MRKMLCAAVALLALNLFVDTASQGQNKAAQKKTAIKQEDPTPEDYAQLRKSKEVYGTITYVDLGTNKMNLRVEIPKQVPNDSPQATRNLNATQQALLRSQQQIMLDYQNAMTSRNPVQQQQRMNKLMLDYQQLQVRMVAAGMSQANMFKTVTTAKEFELDVTESPRVARVQLPQEYDDKGNIVTYTKEELKKKKDDVLPGYTAKSDELQPGQKVKLYLGTPPKKKKATVNPDADKKEPAEPTDDKTETKTTKSPTTGKTGSTKEEPPPPYVRMVLIYREPDPAAQKTPEKKKKKKNDNN